MNEPLITFVAEFREPATTAELWAEIALVRGWSKAADLPATHQDLDDELRLLMVAGRVACEAGLWRVLPRLDKPVAQAQLF